MAHDGNGSGSTWPGPPFAPPRLPAPRPVRPSTLITIAVAVLVVVACAGAPLAAGVIGAITHPRRPHAQVSLPASIGRLRPSTDPADARQAGTIASQLRETGLADVVDSVAGLYRDPAQPEQYVIVVAATALVDDPTAALRLIPLLPYPSRPITHDIDIGVADGVARCQSEAGGQPSTVCGWADPDSVGEVIMPDRDMADGTALFTQVSAAVVTRD